ncbi:uncharacterized protein LOC113512809 [Galleria mellonella]|uniref:Uncharacterized protein LOC113512809 n=1 Tax=Galleria mellonella TaxID=7137 RepID=A0A6J3BZJ3_GALME|nr:uncharacterized protein LOC113512809 [Galleria mellonella]XP_031766883.1 uncharacterized protein LOC113512809 [Galleria mellonella]XP_031766884.1 uncharacterized protein LOC113512809 [Galleria mellonella]
MSDDTLIHIKSRILELFSELDEGEMDYIDKWISSHSYKKDLQNKVTLDSAEKCLIKIAKTIKKLVPFEAEMPSENIVPPTVGNQADCTKESTCHIDEFLYDHKDLEDLTKQGKIKRHYCLDCNSRNIQELTLISHSLSRQTLLYIFKFLLPKDLENKQILDLGSRLGAVLYGAYYFSNVGNIVGVEINKECCDLQETIIGQYAMDTDRIKVIHTDILDRSDVVQNSDIIVVNCLDHFVDVDKHKQIWYFLKKHIKKGSYLITVRSMADTLIALDMFEELSNWLNICKPNQLENEIFFDIEDCNEIYLYTVN